MRETSQNLCFVKSFVSYLFFWGSGMSIILIKRKNDMLYSVITEAVGKFI